MTQPSLRISPVSATSEERGVRDASRPRRVTAVLQVTLPKPHMERIGLQINEWVFLSSLGANRGLLLQPQRAVQLAPRDANDVDGVEVHAGQG